MGNLNYGLDYTASEAFNYETSDTYNIDNCFKKAEIEKEEKEEGCNLQRKEV